MKSGPPARTNARRSSATASAASPRSAKKAAAAANGDKAQEQVDTAVAAVGAAVKLGAVAVEAVAVEVAAGTKDGDKPPPAKRARKDSRAAKAHADEPAGPAPAGRDQEVQAAAVEPPMRARKSRSKAAAAAASPEPPAADGGQEPPEAASEVAAAKPKAKRGQKAEPLPEYTTAMRKPPPPEGSPALRVISWNVAGLRALLKKTPSAVSQLAEREGADVVCLQEHKLQGSHTDDMEAALGLKGWSHYWACSTAKLGYSGVSIHTRTKPLSVTVGLGAAEGALAPDPEHEAEGRVVTVELPAAFVVSVYVPNSGEGLKRLDYRVKSWDGALAAYLKGLEARGKPVVVTGDLNCAHKEIDIHAPKTNLRSAGFTVEERESFGRLLLGEVGLVDTFRSLFPGMVAYTYFTRRFNCREKNKGWRLDYFLTSASLMPPAAAGAAASPPTQWRVYDSWILQDVYGSDHLPLGLTLIQEDLKQ